MLYLFFIIKDLEVYWGNLNILLRKNKIWVEFLIQKKEINKQTTNKLY